MGSRALPWTLCALVLAASFATLVPVTRDASAASPHDALAASLAYLASLQNPDGTFAFVDVPYVVEVLAAAGLDPKAWPTPERPVFEKLAPWGFKDADPEYKRNARIAHAVGSTGYDPRDVNGRDYVALVRAGYATEAVWVTDDMWKILALRAAGVPADDADVQRAALNIEAARRPDGGWNASATGSLSNTDVTGMALAALSAAGRDVRDDTRAEEFLRSMRDAAGGYKDTLAGKTNCNSTVWALHALHLLDEPGIAASQAFVAGLLQPDGHYQYVPGEDTPIRDPWCTAEAVTYFAGARFPLAGFHAGTITARAAHALEPATFAVSGPFDSAAWRLGEDEASGLAVQHAFTSKGTHGWSVLARGPDAVWRASGTLDILSARPRVELSTSAIDTLRGVHVVLDVSRAHDSDGAIDHVEISWGDGAVDHGAPSVFTHAYAQPGHFAVAVRARDDAGFWSDTARVDVRVHNRAPSLEGLPARLVADRVTGLQLALAAADPDGDAVTFSWRFGNVSGDGATVAVVPTRIGDDTLTVTAMDPFGGNATARVRVEVVNLPPTLAHLELPAQVDADAPFAVRVVVEDADGSAPLVEWRVGTLVVPGAQANLSLPEGIHEVTVRARDADGALAEMRAIVAAAPPRASPSAQRVETPPVPPRLSNASVALDGDLLRVAFDVAPADASVWLLRDGAEPVEVRDGAHVPLAGAREAQGVLEARAANLSATVAWGPLRVAAPPLAPPRVLMATDAALVGEDVAVNVAPHAEATEFRFDFGDGNTTAWSPAREATHAWSRPGAYEVRVLARDAERVAEASVVVRVATPAPAPRTTAPTPAEADTALASSAVAEPAAAAADDAPPLMPAAEQRPVPAPRFALLLLAALALARGRPRTRAPSAGR